MADVQHQKIAVLWRGDREVRRAATPQNNRFYRVFEELAALGIDAEPAVYDDDIADEVREQLLISWMRSLSAMGVTRPVARAAVWFL